MGLEVPGIFLDISKAFGKILHDEAAPKIQS